MEFTFKLSTTLCRSEGSGVYGEGGDGNMKLYTREEEVVVEHVRLVDTEVKDVTVDTSVVDVATGEEEVVVVTMEVEVE
ncbi:unnamed protein product [Eruca vesicaria subsp. sativa]|uniref:Uncharacterized protein n=1 Tax=Eruca vesicaria subsp. sativa TaxID=29727 RepID=A0ABC8JJS7_ERUVS|nr:unnamed protein product [Eruca vesicaria subsp. sativa]